LKQNQQSVSSGSIKQHHTNSRRTSQ